MLSPLCSTLLNDVSASSYWRSRICREPVYDHQRAVPSGVIAFSESR